MRDGRLEGPAITSRFPGVFRLPAFASRSSDSRRGNGPSLRSAYRALPPGPRRGLPRFARTSYERGGCLLCPEDGGAPPDWAGFPAGACRFPAASPCAPLRHPIGGADRNETSVGGLGASPVRSASRLWPPDGTGALGLLPDASNPAGNASDARQAEAGPRARARNYAFDLRRTSKQRVHSYACDLASQTRPIFPSPVAPGCNGSVLGFAPSFAPRPCGRRTSRWGQVIEHGPETTLYVIDLASNPASFSQCVRPRVARDFAEARRSRPGRCWHSNSRGSERAASARLEFDQGVGAYAERSTRHCTRRRRAPLLSAGGRSRSCRDLALSCVAAPAASRACRPRTTRGPRRLRLRPAGEAAALRAA